MNAVPFWVEAIVAVLLVMSGILVLASSIGCVRLPTFIQLMHPSALAYTLGNWVTCLAAALYFSALARAPMLHPLLIPILLSVTVPVTTVLLARVSLHRARLAGVEGTPPALWTLRADAGEPATAADDGASDRAGGSG